MADLIEKLKEIGLNTYEAKVYVALLKKYPATGYEVSKQRFMLHCLKSIRQQDMKYPSLPIFRNQERMIH